MSRYILLPAIAFLLFGSCSKDETTGPEAPPREGQPITFEMAYAGAAATRVVTSTDGTYTTTWDDGDQVGLYIVKGNGGLQPSGNWVDNIPMTYNNGSWSYALPAGKDLYPDDGENLSFYAFYPYDPAMSDPTGFTFTVQADQSTAGGRDLSKSDLLMASAKNVSKSLNPVRLEFSHKLALLEVRAKGSSRTPLMENMRVTLVNLRTGVNAKLDAETVTPSDYVVTVEMYRVEQPGDADYGTNYTYRAIIPAQYVSMVNYLCVVSQTMGTVTRTLNGRPNYSFNLPAGQVTPFDLAVQAYIDPNHVYSVGDYYPYKSWPILGIVIEVSNGGKNGKIVSLEQSETLIWGPNVETFATDRNDGLANMATITAIPGWKDEFPALAWVDDQNPSGTLYASGSKGIWYIPSYNELEVLYELYRVDGAAMNVNIVNAGGVNIDGFYWSSTELGFLNNRYWTGACVFPGGMGSVTRINAYQVRAIMAF